jgi:prepilin-type N-terminal cleavage/methylation domain-containing protein
MERRAFTLIEVLIAITIVGIVSSIAVGQYGTAVARARWDAARDILLSIYSGEQTYNTLNGFFRGGLNENTNNMAAWREIFIDDPNYKNPATNKFDVTYRIVNTNTTFTATATDSVSGKAQIVDENRNFGASTWTRP